MIWDDWFRLLDKIKINKLINKCCQQIVDNTCTDSMDAVCYDVSSVLHTVCIQVLTFSFHALTNYFWNGKFRVKIFSADQQHWWKQHWIVANFCESCKKKNELSFIPVQTHPRTDGPNSTGSSNPFERFHQENMAFRGNFCLILLINQKITNMVFSFV